MVYLKRRVLVSNYYMRLPQNDTLIYVVTKNPCGFCTSVDHVRFERAVEVGDFPPVESGRGQRLGRITREEEVACGDVVVH